MGLRVGYMHVGCAACGSVHDLPVACPWGCETVQYCSRACQEQHEAPHSLECRSSFAGTLAFWAEGIQTQAYTRSEFCCEAMSRHGTLSSAWPLGHVVPAQGHVVVAFQRGERLYEGGITFRLPHLRCVYKRPHGRGLLVEVKEDHSVAGQEERFATAPAVKTLRVAVPPFVVLIQLHKVSQPSHIHSDPAGRTFLYEARGVHILPHHIVLRHEQPKQCLCCGAPARQRCAWCDVFYCSRACQKEDWRAHRKTHKKE